MTLSDLPFAFMDPTSGMAFHPSGTRDRPGGGGAPRVWLFPYGRLGDDDQLLTLAEALGWPFEMKTLRPDLIRVALDRVRVHRADGAIPHPDVLAPPWPDLIITIGGRNVATARRIRKLSGGRTRLVQIGRPWAPLDWFDLIITTPQYRLPDRPNVLQNTAPLHRNDPGQIERTGAQWRQRLRALPRPWIAVLAGGASGSYAFDEASARRLAAQARQLAEAHGGSLLATTSARTPRAAADALFDCLKRYPHAHVYRWRPGDADNPYRGYLALADAFIVTGDSASMLADACATGKEVILFDLPWRWLSRLLLHAAARLEGATGRLVERGWWVPPRDLRLYHRALHARGLLKISAGDTPPPRRPLEDLPRAVERIRELISVRQEAA